MQEADRVLSTPPLNSSLVQIANPPPEARAESVDSFSHPPAIGQPESQTLTSESPRPATPSAQIIQFPEPGGRHKFLRKRRVERMARVREAETNAVPLTETCRNARSREGRKGPWDVADVTRHYWRGRLDWESALSLAQSRGIAEGRLHPEGIKGERDMMLD
jgi:hypothetical protein